MDLMDIRRGLLMGMASGGKLDLLQTLTFVNALGQSDRQTVNPPVSWNKYDILLFVPDIIVSSQEGETSGNWLWMGIQRRGATGSGTGASNYNSVGTVGVRGLYYLATLTKGYSLDRYYWRFGFAADRGSQLALPNSQDVDSEQFSDLDITYGGYYGNTNGVLNGTLKIYGCKLAN